MLFSYPWRMPKPTDERCSICHCPLHRTGDYARPTVKGRSHATEHHHVAERFFGRSRNRKRDVRERLFEQCPWGVEGKSSVFCYECHEDLLHNPVFLAEDIERFAVLVERAGLDEAEKPEGREKLAGRIRLFQQVIAAGLKAVEREEA